MSATTEKKNEGGIGEIINIAFQALVIALVIRTLLFQPFNIPSGSMKATLLVGDYIFVSKYSYGYTKFSVPFALIPFEGRIWAGMPKRGDVAVFRNPKDEGTDYIKRVIGLPGDRIQMNNGQLFINGQPVKRELVADWISDDPGMEGKAVKRYRETLPNGVTYETLDLSDSYYDNTPEYLVPAGHYFMMGDNRDNSTDSRVQSAVGYVPFENFIGRAEIIFFSLKEGTAIYELWRWPFDVRWGRIFSLVR
ncbi:MAG: signal peptidase I [Xanthobacteraceae bacterium]|nr:signal peptidase I [Xanthobacteraceae bacterium]MBX3522787.1 signal peptidase I [Xanthobacteraceae bacterium]MBX3550222.1 signal peptidase I [Xanthobacteraceae bacterium]MCW5676164.1 signal peptidase I [Xanthobacteraceae bacterium]